MQLDWRRVPGLLAATALLVLTLWLTAPPKGSGGSTSGQTAPAAGAQAPAATLPSEVLARAVERATRGVSPMPYFVDEPTAIHFLERWQGRLPEGKVLVAMADEVDAGAESGHPIPVRLYLDTGRRVVCLTGEVRFAKGRPGNRIEQLSLKPERLRIDSWEAASGQLRATHGVTAGAASAPFYGRFRFTVGGRRFAVDAATGEVTEE